MVKRIVRICSASNARSTYGHGSLETEVELGCLLVGTQRWLAIGDRYGQRTVGAFRKCIQIEGTIRASGNMVPIGGGPALWTFRISIKGH